MTLSINNSCCSKLNVKRTYIIFYRLRTILVKAYSLFPCFFIHRLSKVLLSIGNAAAENQGWDALGGLYALLAQHDALDGHALARKSVRSPSRRLRFGRRSDPEMPAQAPVPTFF